MDVKAIERSPSLGFVRHPRGYARDRFSTTTSTSSTSIPEVPERSAFRHSHNRSPSSLLMQAYANRPLPRPPPRLPSSASSSAQTGPMECQTQRRMARLLSDRGRQSEFQNSAVGIDSMPPTQKHKDEHHHQDNPVNTATSSMERRSSRRSYDPLSRSARRSSQKIHQLTGLEVNVMDSQTVSLASASSDSSSSRSDSKMDDYGVPDHHLVPVLEAYDDKHSSTGSSWGPSSPKTDAVPAPLNIQKPLSGGFDKGTDDLSGYFPQLGLDDDVMHPLESAHGQFTDVGAAGEYHRFAAKLAAPQPRQLRDSVLSSTTSAKKKRSSLSFPFSAASLLSRRRERPKSIFTLSSSTRSEQVHQDSAKPPRQSPADFVAGPAYSSLSASTAPKVQVDAAPPRPPPAPPLMSAWDSDSDSDEMPVMSSLRDWFSHRATEDNKAHRRMSTLSRFGPDRRLAAPKLGDGQEALARRLEREKQIRWDKAAKRREERQGAFKKSFGVIPEELSISSPKFI